MNSTPESGQVLWKYKIAAQLWAGLQYDTGSLFFGCDDKNFYAFDLESRQIKWQFQTGGIIRSAADISKGIVVFASDDGFLYAVNAASGKELWRFDLHSAAISRRLPAPDAPFEYDYLHSSPVYHDGCIYIGSANGMLYAIDQQSGKERWHFKTSQKIRATPLLHNDIIYFAGWDGIVYALNLNSRQLIWQFDCGGIVQSSPVLGGGNIFVGSRSAKIFALDAQTGAAKWTYVDKEGSWIESSALYDDGIIYMGSSDALKLWAFNATNGQIIWEFKTAGWSWSTPVIAKAVVYIGGISAWPYYMEGIDLKAGFYAVNQKSGRKKWSITPEPTDGYITGGVFTTPEIVDGTIYLASIDGTLYAIKE